MRRPNEAPFFRLGTKKRGTTFEFAGDCMVDGSPGFVLSDGNIVNEVPLQDITPCSESARELMKFRLGKGL